MRTAQFAANFRRCWVGGAPEARVLKLQRAGLGSPGGDEQPWFLCPGLWCNTEVRPFLS